MGQSVFLNWLELGSILNRLFMGKSLVLGFFMELGLGLKLGLGTFVELGTELGLGPFMGCKTSASRLLS